MAVKAIKYGMKGDVVANLQTLLNKYGYNLDVDGSFGPKTLAAVKDYQNNNGLAVDGMVGPQTQSVLFGNNSAEAPPGDTNTVALPGNTKPGVETGKGSAAEVPGVSDSNVLPEISDDAPAKGGEITAPVTVPDKPVQNVGVGNTGSAPATGGGSQNPSGNATKETVGGAAPVVNYPEPFSYGGFTFGDHVSSGKVEKATEKPFSYGAFSYDPYQESETVKQAGAALDAILAAQPGAYESRWADQVNGIIDKILNRESFSYNFNEDPLYWQYADQYTRRGKLAMQDTMGQAASMTGGYGNSYASTAGNQAYQEYLAQLNEIIPELRRMRLDEYNMEGQELYNRYGLLSDQEQQEYGRYMDSYNRWLAERDYAAGRYDSERNFDRSKYVEDRNFAYGAYSDDRNLAYDEYRNAIELAKWQETEEYNKYLNDRNFAYGEYLDNRDLAYNEYLNKIQKAQWDAEFEEGVRQHNEATAFNEKQAAIDRVENALKNGVMPSEEDVITSGLSMHYVQERYNAYDDEQTEVDLEKRKAEAMNMIGVYLSAGMEVPAYLQKQAGLTDDDMAALSAPYQSKAASGSGSETVADEDVPMLTDHSKITNWSDAILECETLEEAEELLVRLHKVDPELATSLYEKWLEEHGHLLPGADTTVGKPTMGSTGGSRGTNSFKPNYMQ